MHFRCSHTAGILLQMTVSFHTIYNNNTRNSSIASCSQFLIIRGKVLVFDDSQVFLQPQRYHLPLLLQSFGVKWRHLGSIRKCLFCIALSCPSTISSESVKIYWPYRKNKSNIRWKPVFSVVFYQPFCWFHFIVKMFHLFQRQNLPSP